MFNHEILIIESPKTNVCLISIDTSDFNGIELGPYTFQRILVFYNINKYNFKI